MVKQNAQSLPKIIGPLVKIQEQDAEKTVFRVVGIPYGGPKFLEGRDLHGQYFSKNTDTGKGEDGAPVMNPIYAYYDHALNEKIGKSLMGKATYIESNDQGEIWDVEVRRAYRYHDMLEMLAQKNLLGASSQPIQTSVEIDFRAGEIKRWHVAEISLTPTPANPLAVAEVLKSFDIKADEPAEDETQDTPDDLADEINDAFDDGDSAGAEIVSEGLAELAEEVKALKAVIEELKSDQANKFKDISTQISSVGSAVKAFAGHVAKRLKFEVQETLDDEKRKSQAERDAEEEAERQTPSDERPSRTKGIPANAPGKRG